MLAAMILAATLAQTPITDARCLPIEGDRAVTITLTSLQKSGSGGAGSLARLFFDLGSPNSPVVALELRANGNRISSIEGPNLMNTAGMKFALPAPGTYRITVYAQNDYGCTREVQWRDIIVVPGVPVAGADYCPTLNAEVTSGWIIPVPWGVNNKISVLLLRGLDSSYPIKNHLIQLDDPRAFTSYDLADTADAFDALLSMGHAPFTYEPVPVGLVDSGQILVHDTVTQQWWRQSMVLVQGPGCGGGDQMIDSCSYVYTNWQNLGDLCPFQWTYP